MNKKAIIIISGGIDSTTLLWKLVKEKYEPKDILAISFNYGQKQIKELEYAEWNCYKLNVEHKVINLQEFMKDFDSALTKQEIEVPNIKNVLGEPQPVTYVPYRNQLFLTIATGIGESVGAKEVYYGAQKHDMYGYWDTTPEFIKYFNKLISLNRKHEMKLITPFANHSKKDTIKEGLSIGVDYSKTRSCYNGHEKSCGTCPTCAERIKGFKDNGVKDPIDYEVEIKW